MNWTKIYDECLSAFLLWHKWEDITDDPLLFYVEIETTLAHNKDYYWFEGMYRRLYDFFDEQGINVVVTRTYSGFRSHIIKVEDRINVLWVTEKHDTRREAETKAFEQAFKVLETKLKEDANQVLDTKSSSKSL